MTIPMLDLQMPTLLEQSWHYHLYIHLVHLVAWSHRSHVLIHS